MSINLSQVNAYAYTHFNIDNSPILFGYFISFLSKLAALIGNCVAHQCIHVYIPCTFPSVICTIFIIFTAP